MGALQHQLEQQQTVHLQQQQFEQQQLELELLQNNQLIDSLTEKVYEVALICTNSKCAKDFDFDRKKIEITKVIELFTDVFIARLLTLVAPEFIAVNKII